MLGDGAARRGCGAKVAFRGEWRPAGLLALKDLNMEGRR